MIEDLKLMRDMCQDAIERHQEAGFSGEATVTWKIFKKLRAGAKTVRIVPSVSGKILQRGNEQHPSVVQADAKKLKVAVENILAALEAVGME